MNAAMKYTELRYQPEKSGIYVGSPSLLRLPDGALLASHDYFEADPVSNLAPRISEIYRSEDGGASWRNVNHLSGALWGSLFLHDDCIYHLGTDREYGSIVIRRSRDGGFSWSDPQDERTGLLFRGGPGRTDRTTISGEPPRLPSTAAGYSGHVNSSASRTGASAGTPHPSGRRFSVRRTTPIC